MADHHISPGKKQWTWGCGDFGKAWDRNLTDEDGPYIEQYRHATWLPDDYYLEGLKRDDGDIRINNAYGMLLLRRGEFARAEGPY